MKPTQPQPTNVSTHNDLSDESIEHMLRQLSVTLPHQNHIPAEPFASRVIQAVQYEAQRRAKRERLLNWILIGSAPVGAACALAIMGSDGMAQLVNSFNAIGSSAGVSHVGGVIIGAWIVAQCSAIAIVAKAERS